MENSALITGFINRGKGGLVVSFSGGVDSSVVAALAIKAVGSRNVVAVTLDFEAMQRREIENAKRIAKFIGIPHRVVKVEKLKDENFCKNDAHRCYYCKKGNAEILNQIKNELGFGIVADGMNYDDITRDYTPGAEAAKEMGVWSPLAEFRLEKEYVRILAKEMMLPNWDREASPCLASRFPYGVEIRGADLRRVESCEECLKSGGFHRNVRVRHIGNGTAVVEVDDVEKALKSEKTIVEMLKNTGGYDIVRIDPRGYRRGGSS